MGAMTLNVRVNGPLAAFVTEKVGPEGRYENVSEYVRDLIRREFEREEAAAFDQLKTELQHAFSVSDDQCQTFDADAFRARMRDRHG